MEKRIICGLIVAVALFVVLIFVPDYIAMEEWQLWFFFFVTFLIVGIIVKGVIRSLLMGFALGLVFTIIIILISSPHTFSKLATEDVFHIILNSAIASVFGALGGFLGNWIFED